MPHAIALESGAKSVFSSILRVPADAIFSLTARYLRDPFSQKVNLGQGTYRDEHGQPWYLPILGLAGFRRSAAQAVLGKTFFQEQESKVATCQSVSGTGALHLAGLLLAGCYLGKPKVIGFECPASAAPGSVFVLHACAHNPTGFDPTEDQWREIGRLMKERELFPVFDAAYLRFNSGCLDQDAFAIRHFIQELQLEAIVCISFSKNMGLYGERVGCVLACASTEDVAARSLSMLEKLQRVELLNPPAHGAKIAQLMLSDEELFSAWKEDLVTMSSRIRSMRWALYDQLNAHGIMFSFLRLSPQIVQDLEENHHIYLAGNSRISMAGLNESNVGYVAGAIAACVRRTLQ
ncbi:pyridoxal phosphate-dependent transferase [Fusarium solani]|uniref:Aspartate aminotransferase n=1 Tax=Fusarium solani TaxID=169388 RepID=A0A9P9HAB9_FUSSL|nr:pyridoxal phosphate-dependent transferase [Fusarium solani]KAH7252954.1 pyridoxal phosphate-dependent transferase [Fusarium solani]